MPNYGTTMMSPDLSEHVLVEVLSFDGFNVVELEENVVLAGVADDHHIGGIGELEKTSGKRQCLQYR